MKRILVVDESQAVRETLVLILEREFVVIPSATPPSGIQTQDADLLILGLSPEWGTDIQSLVRWVDPCPFPTLFLIDSRFTLDLKQVPGKIDWLAKPFNPYELRTKIGRLLVQREAPVRPELSTLGEEGRYSHYLDFPYLSKPSALMAQRFAQTSLPVLIYGELGCGQEQVAKGMHALNGKRGPWISLYLAGVDEESLYRQIASASQGGKKLPPRLTLFLNGLETLDPLAQSWLLRFLDEEEKGRDFWILSSSRVDLLEKVYQGEFLDSLYYRLATLTLGISPLRERREDLPLLASCLAHEYGKRLGLGEVIFTGEALERIGNYLWFGNLNEMEAVIARTLAIQRKSPIEGRELFFGFSDQNKAILPTGPAAWADVETTEAEQAGAVPGEAEGEELALPQHPGNGQRGEIPDLKVLIHELAHELKNPMVTIKTFAQLLGERFDDASFRSRFQDAVNHDVGRMDDLLEVLLEFTRFSHPAVQKILLFEEMRRVLEEVIPESIKKGATIRWGKREEGVEVFVDADQFRYALKNILLTVLDEAKSENGVQIEVAGAGEVVISYFENGGRGSPLGHHLNLSLPTTRDEETLPLRILLAKIVLERNGGVIKVHRVEGGKALIRIELPAP